ncbi:MAG: hypothetical protein H0U63_07930 [Burkholderiales bacterium]|nr:hypothetical protein [Burkholderiales bacterium]
MGGKHEDALLLRRISRDAYGARGLYRRSIGSFSTALAEIGWLQEQLRAEHLAAHLAQRAILSEMQAQKYAELRGYSGKMTHQHAH